LNATNHPQDAVSLATRLVEANDILGEAWNQRALAYAAMGQFRAAIRDCQQTLYCNRFHFPAAVGMGQNYLRLNDAFTALDCFRLAISINPDLECLRNQIRKLEKMLE
jgi:tetratricopeptide (TPR) repeat protein